MTRSTSEEALHPVHPGEILREEFLDPLGITPYRLAKSIGVPLTRVAGILAGRRGITADTALRLGRYFGTSAQFWLNMQTNHVVWEIEREKSLTRIRPIKRPAAAPARLAQIEAEQAHGERLIERYGREQPRQQFAVVGHAGMKQRRRRA